MVNGSWRDVNKKAKKKKRENRGKKANESGREM